MCPIRLEDGHEGCVGLLISFFFPRCTQFVFCFVNLAQEITQVFHDLAEVVEFRTTQIDQRNLGASAISCAGAVKPVVEKRE